MAERSLAHIETITAIEPIQGADLIQLAKLLGWQCVIAKKDDFKVGDRVVYIEIDSVVPERPEFEFLRARKFRIRTIKLKGQISQGLVLPLSVLPPAKYKEGQDVTETLGITHHDPESSLHIDTKKRSKLMKFLFRFKIVRKICMPFIVKVKGSWPHYISKTDEERIQNLGWYKVYNQFKDQHFYVTEKLDGSSATFFYKREKVNLLKKFIVGVCSRNQWLKTPDESIWWKIARRYNIEFYLTDYYKKLGHELVIQGEIIGSKIQHNKYKLDNDIDFYVFNIINLTDSYHFTLKEMKEFCDASGLKTVPVVHEHFILPEDRETLIVMADGKSLLNPNTDREGLVFRCIEDAQKKISFKAISNKFLLKSEE